MRSRVIPFLAIAALGACKPAVPAHLKEKPIKADLSVCRDSHLLYLDPGDCEWTRVDGAGDAEDTDVLLTDSHYCSSYDVSVHPTEPRVFAHMMPDDDRKPEIVREISVTDAVVRTIALPRDVYAEYSGYTQQGGLTVIVSDELPEPNRVMGLVDNLFNRESCALYRARALTFAGDRWNEAASEIAVECGDPAPTDLLDKRYLSPWTMPGTTTLTSLTKTEDRAILDALDAAMDDAEETPVWREAKTPYGRVLRGASDYGSPFWMAFVDVNGRVVGAPQYDDNNKLRMRGAYLLATSEEGEGETSRLYDMRTGQLVWESPSYALTAFWPCPTP